MIEQFGFIIRDYPSEVMSFIFIIAICVGAGIFIGWLKEKDNENNDS